jgi:hypothetical protein
LFFLLVFLIVCLWLINLVYLPMVDRCPFVDQRICFSGQEFYQYNWQKVGAKGYVIESPVKIRTPFAGTFLYSPMVNIDYEGQHLGVLGVLIFKSSQGRVEIYAEKIELLKGFVGKEQEVKKGEIVAEVLPGAISFLNNYSFVKADLTP